MIPAPRDVEARGLVRWAVKQTVYVLILAVALFVPARTVIFPRAWIYVALTAYVQLLTALVLVEHDPALLVERAQLGAAAKGWDIVLAGLMAYSPVLMGLLAGLEARFVALPAGPDLVAAAAFVAALLSTALTLWAMVANTFFSGVVCIQRERGRIVVDEGPYQYVRHPGYAGMLVFTVATPFMLASRWAGLFAVLTVGITVLRTVLEDRIFQRELDGYAAYAARVRYRLVPGIW